MSSANSDAPIRIAPSILASDFARLGEEIQAVEAAGADWIHVDVMDGPFVPNLTIGPPIVRAAQRSTSLPLDVHLMIEEPERYIEEYVAAGATTVGVHVETCPHPAPHPGTDPRSRRALLRRSQPLDSCRGGGARAGRC